MAASDNRNRSPLAQVRQARGYLVLRAFADRSGYSQSTISSVERGHRRMTDGIAAAYQQLLGVTRDELDAVTPRRPLPLAHRWPRGGRGKRRNARAFVEEVLPAGLADRLYAYARRHGGARSPKQLVVEWVTDALEVEERYDADKRKMHT